MGGEKACPSQVENIFNGGESYKSFDLNEMVPRGPTRKLTSEEQQS